MAGGCNNWTIAPSRTAAGRPILANDLHIGPSIPTPWYLCKISTPEFSSVGASFPGVPAVVLGHNGTCSWGMTAGMSDVVMAVNFSRENNIEIAVKGGGHPSAGTAVCDDGMMIDLSPMRLAKVYPEKKTAAVAGGSLPSDVDAATQLHGLGF